MERGWRDPADGVACIRRGKGTGEDEYEEIRDASTRAVLEREGERTTFDGLDPKEVNTAAADRRGALLLASRAPSLRTRLVRVVVPV